MPPISLRVPKALISLGIVLVSAGGLPNLAFFSLFQSSFDFYWIVTAIGYLVLAWALWVWMSALSEKKTGLIGMRRVFLLFAVACSVLGIAYLGLINELIDLHRQAHDLGLRVQAISDGLCIVGFGMATFGFWSVARAAGAGEPGSERETVRVAPAGDDDYASR